MQGKKLFTFPHMTADSKNVPISPQPSWSGVDLTPMQRKGVGQVSKELTLCAHPDQPDCHSLGLRRF